MLSSRKPSYPSDSGGKGHWGQFSVQVAVGQVTMRVMSSHVGGTEGAEPGAWGWDAGRVSRVWQDRDSGSDLSTQRPPGLLTSHSASAKL